MSDLLAYSFGGAMFQAAIFFPITFLAIKPHVRLRSGLRTAWHPFFYVIVLLTIANAVETASGSSQSATTLPGFFLFLVVPIAVSAAVLFVTFRQKRGRTAPNNEQAPGTETAAPHAEKIGAEIIDAILENDPVKVAEAVRKVHSPGALVIRAAPQVDRRRLVLVVAATVAALMLLFPPFHVVVQAGSGNFGYAWLFNPPRSMGRVVATVDVFTLLVEYLGLLLVTALLYLALPDRPAGRPGIGIRDE